ncbi:MAG: DUF1194 domain-containing protein [Rhodobacteraceae bacterium]|nr:DUF1194 domain-containing protein [Paracoccaceae bacterium]
MRRLLALICLLVWTTGVQAACRQALVLALDVSSSVDEAEYILQMQGLAGALRDPDVQAYLLSQPQAPVSIAVFEWGGHFDQTLIIPWRSITAAADLDAIAASLAARIRSGPIQPTSIGGALAYAGRLLEKGPSCWQQTIDVSGDGKNNDGIRPRRAKQAAIFQGIIVNGLVIGEDTPDAETEIGELVAYYQAEVIHGPTAFTETALGFADYGRAMKRKLLRELSLAVAARQRP